MGLSNCFLQDSVKKWFIVYYEVGYVLVVSFFLVVNLVDKVMIFFCGGVGGYICFMFDEEVFDFGLIICFFCFVDLVVVLGG